MPRAVSSGCRAGLLRATLGRMTPPGTEILKLRAPPRAIPVRWRASARAKRVSLRICPRQAEVVVTLPHLAGRRAGIALIREHADWVIEKLARLSSPLDFVPGAALPLGGVAHVVRHEPYRRGGPFLEDGALVVTGARAFLRRRLADFLRAEAQRRITRLAQPHAVALGVTPRAIRVKDPRSRWGSCAPDGTLAFSWRLVMAPEWVADYVVAHEVAHLRELNHSPRFWALLDGLTPHREAAVAWLRAEGPALLRVG